MKPHAALAVAAVASVVLVLTPAACRSAVNPYAEKLGVSPGGNRAATYPVAFAGAADTGATWTRLDFSWPTIEQVRGQHTWGEMDTQVGRARRAGLEVLGVLTYAPAWAHHPGCAAHPCAPAADKYDDFARFAAEAAARYQGHVDHWEVWNEPNETRFFKPAPDPAGYAQILRLTRAAIRQVNPAASVLLGGLSTHATDTADYLTWRTFMDRFYAAGGAPFDGFAIHPYYSAGRPTHVTPDNPFINLPSTRDYLAAHGDGTKKIWITEFGYQTGALTPRKQGERLREALTQVVKWSFVERIFVFAWMDFRDGDRLLTWGLNDVDGGAKESRWMLRSLVRSHA